MIRINEMTDDEFDEWFVALFKAGAEETIKEIEASEEYKNHIGLSQETINRIMKIAKSVLLLREE